MEEEVFSGLSGVAADAVFRDAVPVRIPSVDAKEEGVPRSLGKTGILQEVHWERKC